jgi:hypothetical protein
VYESCSNETLLGKVQAEAIKKSSQGWHQALDAFPENSPSCCWNSAPIVALMSRLTAHAGFIRTSLVLFKPYGSGSVTVRYQESWVRHHPDFSHTILSHIKIATLCECKDHQAPVGLDFIFSVGYVTTLPVLRLHPPPAGKLIQVKYYVQY